MRRASFEIATGITLMLMGPVTDGVTSMSQDPFDALASERISRSNRPRTRLAVGAVNDATSCPPADGGPSLSSPRLNASEAPAAVPAVNVSSEPALSVTLMRNSVLSDVTGTARDEPGGCTRLVVAGPGIRILTPDGA